MLSKPLLVIEEQADITSSPHLVEKERPYAIFDPKGVPVGYMGKSEVELENGQFDEHENNRAFLIRVFDREMKDALHASSFKRRVYGEADLSSSSSSSDDIRGTHRT